MNIKSLSRVKLVLAHLPWKIMIMLFVWSLALAGLTFGPDGVAAQSPSNSSPFVGHWQAIDVDSSDIRLTIAGPLKGPFQITWTESYFGYCGGKAGIARGRGWLVESDVLTADLRLVCFTTNEKVDFEITWVYDAGTDTISSSFLTWRHPQAQAEQCVAPPAGLSGWWPGDEGPNDLVAGRDGLFRGDATTVSGLVNMAFRLDGDGDFIEVPNAQGLDFGPGAFTVDLWVNFNETTGEQVLVEKWIQGDGYVDGWSLTKLDSQILRLAIDSGGGNETDLDSGELSLQAGKWYHVAATRQGAAYTLYLNGVPVAQDAGMGASNLNSLASLKFGHRGSPDDTPGSIDDRGFYLNGRIDEVEIHAGSALSGEQIMMLYQAGTAGKCKDTVETYPALDLRVNYGHDWVESFYEAGHSVLIAVTEGDGQTIRATAALVTEAKDFWGGETGFQTKPEDWDPAPPDIQPGDWVFGWVDNGASAQVQIGEIDGTIDLEGDSIQGTINASWFADEVNVECFPWGSPEPQPEMKYDSVFPNGEDMYSCSWAGEWDIQPHQDVGVGYFGADNHWVANAFFARAPRILASVSRNWFQAEDFTPNAALTLSIFESQDPGASLLWEDFRTADDSGFVFVGEWEHPVDLAPGNYLVVSDGSAAKQLVLEAISLDVFDPEMDYLAGTAPASPGGRWVWVGTGNESGGCSMDVTADPETGAWEADFALQPCDVTEDMWAAAQVFDEDGDATEANPPPPPNTRFTVFPEWNYLEGYEWPDGAVVSISVAGKEVCSTSATAGFPEWDPWNTFFSVNFPEGCAIEVGDLITLSFESLSLTHQVQELAITEVDLDLDTVTGTAVFDPEQYILHTWIHGVDGSYMQLSAEGGTWLADFSLLEFDLKPGIGGRAELVDQASNATAVEWHIPNPVIFAHPAYEAIEGTGWTPGDEVTITVDDPTNGTGIDYTDAQTVDDDTWVRFSLHDFDLQVGHIITMTDGPNTRTMVVSNLRVTGFNLDGQTVSGVGDPGSEVLVADNGMVVPVDGDGNWSATFVELLPGTWWTVIHVYPDGNEVRETFRVPEPQISAHPAYNFIEGHEWTPGGEVTIMIDDPANGEGVDYTQTAAASENINYLYDTSVQFALAFDLKAGDKVTMTDGQYTQEMIVSSLRVMDFNLSALTVYGVADPGSEVLIADNGIVVLVDGDGNWSATLADLLPGSWWTVVHVYPDRNQTVETFRAPAPSFYVTPEEDEIFAAEWTPGQTLEAYVNDVLIVSQTVPDVGSYYGPEVMFELPVDLLPGDLVTLTDGRWTKELIVANLQVTGFDLTSPITIYGTADPGPLFIGINGSEMWLEVGEDGMWSVSFPGSTPGDWGSVIQEDEDGDQTRAIFMIPYP